VTTGGAELPLYPFPSSSPLEPPAEFAQLRADEPVSRVRLETGEPAWLLTRYADIRSVLGDHRLTTWFPGVSLDAGEDTSGLLFVMNGPAHVRLRRLMPKALTPRRVENLRPGLAHLADQLVAALTEQGPPADLLGVYAAQLSIGVLCELLGVPPSEREGFRVRSNAMMGVFSAPTPEEMTEAGEKVLAFVAELISSKRRQPGDDLLGALGALGAVGDSDEDRLSDTELQNLVLTVLLAGYVPPANAMALGVLRLFCHPDQLEALRAEPSLIATTVEELLRIDQGSTTDQLRIATSHVEIGEVVIQPREIVVAPLRCANRDPAVFADPDRFDITRSDGAHLSFAHGPHHCLGAALGRLQLQVGIGALVAGLPNLRLAVPFEELSWTTLFFTLTGPQTVPVTW